MGGGWRFQEQLARLHQASHPAAESQSQVGTHCSGARSPFIHDLLYERLVHGLRSGIQVQHRRQRRF